MLEIIKDCEFVARVKVSKEALERFLSAADENTAQQMHTLLNKKYESVVSFKQKVRIRRIPGKGWYELTGYREDGSDLRSALKRLEAADREELLQQQRAIFENARRAQTCAPVSVL